jgi:hypothetical protein
MQFIRIAPAGVHILRGLELPAQEDVMHRHSLSPLAALILAALVGATSGCATIAESAERDADASDHVASLRRVDEGDLAVAMNARRECAGQVTGDCYRALGWSAAEPAIVACVQPGIEGCERIYHDSLAGLAGAHALRCASAR